MMDTKVGTEEQDDAATFAQAGLDAMMDGESDGVTGLKNKIQSSVANITPNELLAKQQSKNGGAGNGEDLSDVRSDVGK